jgi:hypothetical protein
MAPTHEENRHRGHCNTRNCLMYYAVETTAVLDSLFRGSIPELDAACRNDLIGLRSSN